MGERRLLEKEGETQTEESMGNGSISFKEQTELIVHVLLFSVCGVELTVDGMEYFCHLLVPGSGHFEQSEWFFIVVW